MIVPLYRAKPRLSKGSLGVYVIGDRWRFERKFTLRPPFMCELWGRLSAVVMPTVGAAIDTDAVSTSASRKPIIFSRVQPSWWRVWLGLSFGGV
jgi:hypothetical protein